MKPFDEDESEHVLAQPSGSFKIRGMGATCHSAKAAGVTKVLNFRFKDLISFFEFYQKLYLLVTEMFLIFKKIFS